MRATIKKVVRLPFGERSDAQVPVIGPERAATEQTEGVVLLVSCDKQSQQWAPRWLRQEGFGLETASTFDEASEILSRIEPTVVIADAKYCSSARTSLLESNRQRSVSETPVIALCKDSNDIALAARSDVEDIVRRPYDWGLIARRVAKTVQTQRTVSALQLAHARLDEMNAQVSEAASSLARNAGLDPLTKLPNVEKFRSLLHKATSGRGSRNQSLCLLAIGIDRFRLVNEAVGHQNANSLLSQFADRLRNCLRKREVIGDVATGSVTAIAGRLGGARFGLLVSHGDETHIELAARSITRELEEPFEVAGQSIYLTVSIGAAFHPRDCENVDELMQNAESTMLDVQQLGSRFQFFSDLGKSGSHEILALDVMLRKAVRRKELKLAYQPIADANTGEIVAAEALLRWQHPKQGMISPALFVPIAETTGLMHEIGEFVLTTACAQLRHWIDSGMKPIRMAVNLSLCQFLRGDIVCTVERALHENDLTPDLLELELSERGVLNQRTEIIDTVHRLKSLGVRISVDDFGTGQSAISYLKDLPIDVVKIDRSYISGESSDGRGEAIASGMVLLAQGLDATVIAEGVETREQLQMVQEWGSEECQGYYHCPAISGDEFETRFAESPTF